ncbi:hypothetical protein QVD99_000954 [Batrachochytrium dendrobatidis]|nr:hypothetical protein QVD99_000954 [Batrachochytrium dendrobatidis]
MSSLITGKSLISESKLPTPSVNIRSSLVHHTQSRNHNSQPHHSSQPIITSSLSTTCSNSATQLSSSLPTSCTSAISTMSNVFTTSDTIKSKVSFAISPPIENIRQGSSINLQPIHHEVALVSGPRVKSLTQRLSGQSSSMDEIPSATTAVGTTDLTFPASVSSHVVVVSNRTTASQAASTLAATSINAAVKPLSAAQKSVSTNCYTSLPVMIDARPSLTQSSQSTGSSSVLGFGTIGDLQESSPSLISATWKKPVKAITASSVSSCSTIEYSENSAGRHYPHTKSIYSYINNSNSAHIHSDIHNQVNTSVEDSYNDHKLQDLGQTNRSSRHKFVPLTPQSESFQPFLQHGSTFSTTTASTLGLMTPASIRSEKSDAASTRIDLSCVNTFSIIGQKTTSATSAVSFSDYNASPIMAETSVRECRLSAKNKYLFSSSKSVEFASTAPLLFSLSKPGILSLSNEPTKHPNALTTAEDSACDKFLANLMSRQPLSSTISRTSKDRSSDTVCGLKRGQECISSGSDNDEVSNMRMPGPDADMMLHGSRHLSTPCFSNCSSKEKSAYAYYLEDSTAPYPFDGLPHAQTSLKTPSLQVAIKKRSIDHASCCKPIPRHPNFTPFSTAFPSAATLSVTTADMVKHSSMPGTPISVYSKVSKDECGSVLNIPNFTDNTEHPKPAKLIQEIEKSASMPHGGFHFKLSMADAHTKLPMQRY